MLTAIQEIADYRSDEEKEHLAALAYLKACNLLFENGTLSHTPIYNMSSETLKNLRKGFDFFKHWKDSFSAGIYMHDFKSFDEDLFSLLSRREH